MRLDSQNVSISYKRMLTLTGIGCQYEQEWRVGVLEGVG